MPRRKSLTRRLLEAVLLISLARFVLTMLGLGRAWDEWDSDEPEHETAAPQRGRPRRFAMTLSFCALFFSGLALSAGAGDGVRALLENDHSLSASQLKELASATDTTATDATSTDASATASAPQTGQVGAGDDAATDASTADATAASADPVVAAAPAAPKTAVVSSRPSERFVRPATAEEKRATAAPHVVRAQPQQRPSQRPKQHRLQRKTQKHHAAKPQQPLDAEASLPGATVWLYQDAPDPTPPAARLRLGFARGLVAYARQAHVDWALVLAVLRANGNYGRVPATRAELRTLSARLAATGGRANAWISALSYSRDTTFADRVVALRHYYRAVGLPSLVQGLLSQKKDLADRVLHDPRITIYAGGRQDVEAGKVDVRVLAAVLYLANSFHQVTVSCFVSGHRLYARPGVISAHIYGRAADIAALDGKSIYGHQNPGGITEQAVRALLMLPHGVLPQQVISLLGLGGPSFALANHYDHIHVGY